jgi:hypothetical protein
MQTKGEYRVGKAFNPSGDDLVAATGRFFLVTITGSRCAASK